MSTANIIGLVLLFLVIIVGVLLKLYTWSKLKEMDGLGTVHTQESEDDKVIYI